MEPSDLNPLSPESGDDELEMLLRRAAPAAVANNGFSTRVLAALPPSSTRTRRLLVMIAAVMGTALAAAGVAASGGPASLSAIVDERFGTLQAAMSSSSGPTGIGLALAGFATVVTLLYVFRPRLARRLGMAF